MPEPFQFDWPLGLFLEDSKWTLSRGIVMIKSVQGEVRLEVDESTSRISLITLITRPSMDQDDRPNHPC